MGESEGVTVTLTQGFFLGKTEVTQGQWQQVMGKVFHGQKYNVEYKNFPALGITWDEATEFCQKLTAIEHKNGRLPAGESYRLPTEAEWEYACRAGTTTAFSFGDDESELGDYAWWSRHVDLYKMKRLNDVNVALYASQKLPARPPPDLRHPPIFRTMRPA